MIVLEGIEGILIKQELKFELKVSNNHAECKALITCMVLSLKIGALRLKAKRDSQLVSNQVLGEYQRKEKHQIFKFFKVKHMPKEKNFRENILSKLSK